MNERYLYKGKRKSDGKWIEGLLIVPLNRPPTDLHIMPLSTETEKYCRNYYEVDPVTIGQCTGRKDKNGALIFESDILKCSRVDWITKVEWHVMSAQFLLINDKEQCHAGMSFYGNEEMYIIGNIHDSPELLTGGQSTPRGEGIPTEKKAGGKNTRKKFEPPTLEQIRAYCQERGNDVDPQKFFDFFNESGWIDSRGNPVRNWKQKVITWEGRGFPKNPPAAQTKPKQNRFVNFNQREKDYSEIEKLERAYLEQKYGSG